MKEDAKKLKKIEGQLNKSVKSHAKQAKTLQKIAGKYMNKK